MVKRLFIVVNPTQYLNAVEYAFENVDGENHMVILTPFNKGINAINEHGALSFWDSVSTLDLESYKKSKSEKVFWTDCWNHINTNYQRIQPDELILGNIIDSFIYPFLLKVKNRHKDIIVLDDGTPTLGVADKRQKGKFYIAYHFRSIRLLIKTFLYLKVIPPLFRPPQSLTFFSIYNIPFRKTDRVIVNEFKWLKSQITNSDISEETIFIGSHLVDRKILSKSVYLNSIKWIKSEMDKVGKEMIYIHHRGESEEMRTAIGEICKTKSFDKPLELVFLDQTKPAVFSGHFTSALYTLARIYPEVKTKAYLFPDEVVDGSEYESKSYILGVQNDLRKDPKVECITLPVV